MTETYNLRVLVDDSAVRKLEDRLNKIMGISGTGGKTGSSGGGIGGKGGFGQMAKSLGKLGMIGAGIAAILISVKKIAQLVVNSSPMLQGMFKLFNTSIMFIFRPIGDFIGFFLRPIMIMLLKGSVEFYRAVGPLMREWGSGLGILVADGIMSIINFIKDPAAALSSLVDVFIKSSGLGIIIELLGKIFDVTSVFNVDLGSISAGISEKFSDLMSRVTDILSAIFGPFINSIKEIFAGLSIAFSGLVEFFDPLFSALQTVFGGIFKFFAGIWESITNTLQPAWDALTGMWTGIMEFFRPLFEAIQGLIGFFTGDRSSFTESGQAAARARTGEGGSSSNTTINFYDANISSEQDMLNTEERLLDIIERSGRGRFRT